MRPSSLGNYAIQDLLGQGATACVFLARHEETGEKVAAKVMLPSQSRNPEIRHRFKREGHLGQAVRSKYVMGVFSSGVWSKLPYMICELLTGVPLDKAITVKGCIDWQRAAVLGLKAAKGLRDLHRLDIVHRDIKPGNLFVTRKGSVKVVDLGLAKRLGENPEETTGAVTISGSMVGTPSYMAPEQVLDSQSAGKQADVYSLCATLFAMLEGRPPFTDANPCRVLQLVLEESVRLDPAAHPQAPKAFIDLINRGLDKSPFRRPADGEALVHELAELVRAHGADDDSSARRAVQRVARAQA